MRKSIYKKIQKRMLFGSAIAALAVCIAAIIIILLMRDGVRSISNDLGSSAANDSKVALEIQMERAMIMLAESKASISDEKLSAVSNMVKVVANKALLISSNPEAFLPQPPDFPDASNEGITVSQLRIANEDYYELLEDKIGLLGNISGILVSLHDSLDYIASIYIGTESGISISADGDSHLKQRTFDPRTRGWYKSAVNAGHLTWSDVFADNSGRGLGISCVKPFYDSNGNLLGVAGAGMLLDVLKEIVLETTVGKTGYAFISNEIGEMIISDTLIFNEDNTYTSQNISTLLPPDGVIFILEGTGGVHRTIIDEHEYLIANAPLLSLPWSLSIVISIEEVTEPAVLSELNIRNLTDEAISYIDRIIIVALGILALALVLTFAGNYIMAKRMASNLAKPIIDMSIGAEIIGSGDLEYRLDVRTGDELEALSDTFNEMIDNIKTITSEKERISAELDVATKIQASMLPCIFPPYPERSEFDIYADMQPAKEVGGDFYDFFLVDDNTLAIVIADVSGKGIPAALFMVIAKTLIKNNAQMGKSPKEVFETVNKILCENNDADMFVTAFMGFLDIPSGLFTFVNAGHNPPLIKRAGHEFEFLNSKRSFVLAGFEGTVYTQEEISLSDGDVIFMYTDGVTEAMDKDSELFSDPRLLSVINDNRDLCIRELLVKIKAEVYFFADGAEQADDITMLMLGIL